MERVGGRLGENRLRLHEVVVHGRKFPLNEVVDCLGNGSVILMHGVIAEHADTLMEEIATAVGLQEELELQAGFAAFLGHRTSVGRFFMTVNSRSDFQFIGPHSEGDGNINMQLAAFFCFENTTDGGETVLLEVDEESASWCSLRESVTRLAGSSRPLTLREFARVRAVHRLRSPADYVKASDRVFSEKRSDLPGVQLAHVLAEPEKAFSRLLDRKIFTYWDTISAVDHTSLTEFARLLDDFRLLKRPQHAADLSSMDSMKNDRIWSSNVGFERIFKSALILRLTSGDLVICSNHKWAHAAANWTPSTGVRRIAAAFA